MTDIAHPRPALKLTNVTKRFGANTALNGASLTLYAGQIHALVGMNGSGKSTMVKLLSGFHTADEGTIELLGANPGVGFVHQDLALIDNMTVLENMTLGRKPNMKRGVIDWRQESTRAEGLLRRFGIQHLLYSPVGEITKAEATIVAIARALGEHDGNTTVLVLDEPTSTLPAAQTEQLLKVMQACAEDGIAVLFISHRLQEVLSIAPDVTVLYNGKVVYSGSTTGMDVASLAARIGSVSASSEIGPAGTQSAPAHGILADADAKVILSAESVSGLILTDCWFNVRRGEVLGIIGMLGSGVEEIGRYISGRSAPLSGTVRLASSPTGRIDLQKVGYVPSDRARNAVLSGLSARENASITGLKRFLRTGAINVRAEREAMKASFEAMTVYPPDTEAPMLSFSGGNQQKILFARWLHTEPEVLVAEEPTQGVDVHAKAQILENLHEYARSGRSVVLITGEPEEIYAYCDRIIVVDGGRIISELGAPITGAEILKAMHEREVHVD
ncbi:MULTISPECIES: sugar ABC transporter ATP-binding protein [unclassified Arthrobacter]|uniref:sugar ABC transporter ATP-binding protein n=1 Tax=unclassified Arthrobacter TaxID=235627 RepID=UPI0015E3F1CD|nr:MULTISPECIES: sugar ABC transporter ATP-binding protein [unclassified Arthrobacter]